MARKKREIEAPDLSSPPCVDDFFDAMKQILTPTRKQAKGGARIGRRRVRNSIPSTGCHVRSPRRRRLAINHCDHGLRILIHKSLTLCPLSVTG